MRARLKDLRDRLVAILAAGVLAFFRSFELERAVRVGAALGRLHVRLHGARVSDAHRSVEIAFPALGEAERERIVEGAFASAGRSLAEVAHLTGPARERLLAGVRGEGHAHFWSAREMSPTGGVLVLTAHFGSWELCGAALAAQGWSISAVQRERGNPYLARLVTRWRSGPAGTEGIDEIALGRAGFGVFRALRRGRSVLVLLDQDAGRREGVFAPFFGVPARTRDGAARVAMRLGIPVLPIFCFRQGEGPHHLVRADPPLELEPAGDDPEGALARNVALMNAAIERVVREAPDQWLWAHRRWASRPPGEERLYPSRRSPRRFLRRLLSRPHRAAARPPSASGISEPGRGSR